MAATADCYWRCRSFNLALFWVCDFSRDSYYLFGYHHSYTGLDFMVCFTSFCSATLADNNTVFQLAEAICDCQDCSINHRPCKEASTMINLGDRALSFNQSIATKTSASNIVCFFLVYSIALFGTFSLLLFLMSWLFIFRFHLSTCDRSLLPFYFFDTNAQTPASYHPQNI